MTKFASCRLRKVIDNHKIKTVKKAWKTDFRNLTKTFSEHNPFRVQIFTKKKNDNEFQQYAIPTLFYRINIVIIQCYLLTKFIINFEFVHEIFNILPLHLSLMSFLISWKKSPKSFWEIMNWYFLSKILRSY